MNYIIKCFVKVLNYQCLYVILTYEQGEIALMEGGGGMKDATGKRGQIMTLNEVAKYLNIHVMTLYKLTREGRVPAAKIGGQWRFKRDVLDEWLEAQMRSACGGTGKHSLAKA